MVSQSLFRRRKPYYDLSNPDYGYRLLTVFRFWNMVEYFFPSKYLTDKDWNDVLPEYIRRMAHPTGSYLRETRRMIAELDDNHAQYGGGIFELFGRYRVPLNTGFVEGRLIVVRPIRPGEERAESSLSGGGRNRRCRR